MLRGARAPELAQPRDGGGQTDVSAAIASATHFSMPSLSVSASSPARATNTGCVACFAATGMAA